MNRDDRGARKRRGLCIAILLENLPHQLRGLWLTLQEILDFLHDGGAKSISYQELKCLFQRSPKIKSLYQKNQFKQIFYYSYGPCSTSPSTPRSRKHKLPAEYFVYFGSRHIHATLTTLESYIPDVGPNENNSPRFEPDVSTLTDNQQNYPPSVHSPSTVELTAESEIDTVDITVETAEPANENNTGLSPANENNTRPSEIPVPNDTCENFQNLTLEENETPPDATGYKFMSIELDRQWTATVCAHIRGCPNSELKCITLEKKDAI